MCAYWHLLVWCMRLLWVSIITKHFSLEHTSDDHFHLFISFGSYFFLFFTSTDRFHRPVSIVDVFSSDDAAFDEEKCNRTLFSLYYMQCKWQNTMCVTKIIHTSGLAQRHIHTEFAASAVVTNVYSGLQLQQ